MCSSDLEVNPGESSHEFSVPFSSKLDLTNLPLDFDVKISVNPGIIPAAIYSSEGISLKKYAHSIFDDAFLGGEKDVKPWLRVLLKWDDGTGGWQPAEIKVVALPEDEIGAYKILDDGTKEYLLFHTYAICMDWLGRDEICRGYERCFHKEGYYAVDWWPIDLK